MSITGIVVNFRTPDLTCRAVRSLLDDGVDDVVVVDNSSSDSASSVLRELGEDRQVRYLDTAGNVGFGRAVNAGVSSTDADLLFLLNSDAEAQPGATAALRRALDRSPTMAIAAPVVRLSDGTEQPDAHGVFPSIRHLLLRTNRHPPDTTEPDWVSGVAMLLRAEAFRAVGGFDERFFMYFEDIDLCRRIRAAGYDIVRVRDAVVVHRHQASSESSLTAYGHYLAAQDVYAEAAGWARWRVTVLRALRRPVRWVRGRAG